MEPETRLSNLETLYDGLCHQINLLKEELESIKTTNIATANSTSNQLNRLREDMLSILSNNVTTNPNPKPKLPLPPIFTGAEPAAHLLDAELSNWAFMAQHYLTAVGMETDPAGVYVIAARLQGHAASWYRSQCTTHSKVYHNPRELIHDLLEAFKPTNAIEQARDALAELTQQDNVQEYTRRFKQLLLAIPDIHESEILDRYKRGLKPMICQQVKLQKCTNLETMITVALSAENIHDKSNPIKPFSQNYENPSMDIDAVELSKIQSYPFKKLSPEEREILYKYQGCFKCRRVYAGHTSTNCPDQKPSPPAKDANAVDIPQDFGYSSETDSYASVG